MPWTPKCDNLREKKQLHAIYTFKNLYKRVKWLHLYYIILLHFIFTSSTVLLDVLFIYLN